MKTQRIRLPMDHPSFKGHFPGQPIVPGSLLLEFVLAAWGNPVEAVPSVKFHRPVFPGDDVTLCFTPAAKAPAICFRCLREDVPVCSGLLLPAVAQS